MRAVHTMFALAIPLGGCFTYPCETDVLQCEDGEAFEVDRTCEASEPLTAELLEMATLDAVQAGDWPIVHEGAQGGIHFDLGLRVSGLDAGHIQLRASVDVSECEDAQCAERTVFAQRTLSVDESVLEPEGESFLLPDVVVLLDDVPRSGEVAIDLLDACGRELRLVHRVAQ